MRWYRAVEGRRGEFSCGACGLFVSYDPENGKLKRASRMEEMFWGRDWRNGGCPGCDAPVVDA